MCAAKTRSNCVLLCVPKRLQVSYYVLLCMPNRVQVPYYACQTGSECPIMFARQGPSVLLCVPNRVLLRTAGCL
jgi:hypothetical protein